MSSIKYFVYWRIEETFPSVRRVIQSRLASRILAIKQGFQDWIRPQAAITGDSVTDQRQAANCECSSLFYFHFVALPPESQGGVLFTVFSCKSQDFLHF